MRSVEHFRPIDATYGCAKGPVTPFGLAGWTQKPPHKKGLKPLEATVKARKSDRSSFAMQAAKPSKPRILSTRVKVEAERHQAPFAANLFEAANEEVAIAGAAFERAEGMFDDGGTTAHQVACAFHPRAMTFEKLRIGPAPPPAGLDDL
jgi:hypothetical protein